MKLITKTSKNEVFISKSGIMIAVLAAGVLLTANGYCADGAAPNEMETITTSVVDTIFSPWVKKTALAFGAGVGLFQSWAAGSVKPLLVWGGLGMAVNYVPKLINMLANFGT